MRLFLLFLFLITTLKANSIEISGPNRISLLENSFNCIVDDDLTVQEVIEQDLFQEYEEPYFLGGITTKAIWIRFTLKNSTQRSVSKALVLTSPFLEKIALYSKDSLEEPSLKGLSYFADEDRTILPFYRIVLKEQSSQEYYLKIKNSYSPVGFALEVQDELEHKEHDRYKQTYYIILITIIFVLMVVSIVMLSSNRWAYVFYSMYLLVLIVQQATYVGLTKVLIEPGLLMVDAKFIIVKLALLISTFALFTRHFLSTQGKINYFYSIMIAISVLQALVMYLFPSTYSLTLMVFTGATFITFNFAIGTYIWLTQRQAAAKCFIIGYSAASASYMVIIANTFGLSSIFAADHEMVLLGTIMEASIFLFAFGHYNKISNLERNIDKLKEEKKNIEEKVLEHSQEMSAEGRLTIYDDCHYFLDTKELMLNGKIRHLLPKQRILLELLLAQKNRVVTYEEIGAKVWEGSGYTNKAISELASTLRSTLENRKIIKNRSGIGYILEIQ